MTITAATLLARFIEAAENPCRLPGATRAEGHPEAHQRWNIGGYRMLVDVEPGSLTRSVRWLPAKQVLGPAHLGLDIMYDLKGTLRQAILSNVGPAQMSAHHFGYRLTRTPNGTEIKQWLYFYSNLPQIYAELPEKLRRPVVMDAPPHIVERVSDHLPCALHAFVHAQPNRSAATTAQAA